ncbi:glycerophosphodiester phosphodiesterase family protein [Roseomonas gilardii]|uniref:Glycerophosphodiester phosphodiesterase family protein n=1 Tax=Roseomonas gilardii TaxID=257708 RepID=A0ABU3MCW7_9PROT|nr:glycerophosphodiester phosphodiesterase family protein [Roseomonas gilardii]MDT8330710.1 glycerophosphodiester phosphodiesterase family protein [Roseomonas gilardii]
MVLPRVIAHRGCSTFHRENSPAAWRGAMEAGADLIEADLRLTADGRIVCCHDADLRRLAAQPLVLRETSAVALAGIAAGGVPVAPPLALLFDTLPEAQPILFDVKDERPEALDAILDALRGVPARPVTLGLHALDSVVRVRAAGWDGAILGFLGPGSDEEAFFTAGGTHLRLWEWDTAPGRIAAHTERGRPVWITTGEGATGRKVGDFDPAALRRMAGEGAGGFLVNDPAAARRALVA